MEEVSILDKIYDFVGKITDFNFVFAFIVMVLLVDTYSLCVFSMGIFEMNILDIFCIKNIKHLIIFITISGTVFLGISSLLYSTLVKCFSRLLYRPKDHMRYMNVNELFRISIDEKDSFLYNYAIEHKKNIKRSFMNVKIIYALLFSFIVNLILPNSLLRILLNYIIYGNILYNKILLLLIIIPILLIIFITIYNSIAFDEEDVYFKRVMKNRHFA